MSDVPPEGGGRLERGRVRRCGRKGTVCRRWLLLFLLLRWHNLHASCPICGLLYAGALLGGHVGALLGGHVGALLVGSFSLDHLLWDPAGQLVTPVQWNSFKVH